MNRLQKNLAGAVGLLVLGGGAGIYTLVEKVKTPEERRIEQIDAQRLFHFGRIHVTQGELHAKNATITFERGETGWRLTQPVAWPADNEAISAMLDRLAGLRIDPEITDRATPDDLRQSGLDRPAIRLAVTLQDGRREELLLGRLNKLSGKFPATNQDRRRIGLTSDDGYWAFDRSAYELRDKRLLPLKNAEVQRVHLQTKTPLVLARTPEGWRAGDDQADQGLAELFLTQLTVHLKAERFITDRLEPNGLARYGLDRPLAEVTVESEGQRYELVFAEFQETAAPEPTLVCWRRGTQTVAAIAEATHKVLAESNASLRDRTIARYDPKKAARLELTIGASPTFAAERGADGVWVLVEPQRRRAKAYVIDAVLNGYSGLRGLSLVSEQASDAELERWKLAPPAWRVVVKDTSGAALADVAVGDYDGDTQLYARANGSRRVLHITDAKAKVLPSSPEALAEAR